MKQTGQQFDINPDTFTLQNVFAMELHQYKDAISDIVAAAQKELSIEKVKSAITNVGNVFKKFTTAKLYTQ